MIVSQLMSRSVTTCRPEDSLEAAAGRMWDDDIGCVPILNAEGRVVGIVTDRDACMAAYTRGEPLSAISIESVMARPVHSCLPSDRVEQAEAVMREHQVRRLPVIDREGRLVGILSMNDIARESALELKRRSPEVTADSLVTTLAGICQPRQQGWNVPATS